MSFEDMAINFLSHTLGFQSNEPEEGQRASPGGTGAPLWEAGRGHKFDPWLGNLCSCVLHVQPKKKKKKDGSWGAAGRRSVNARHSVEDIFRTASAVYFLFWNFPWPQPLMNG